MRLLWNNSCAAMDKVLININLLKLHLNIIRRSKNIYCHFKCCWIAFGFKSNTCIRRNLGTMNNELISLIFTSLLFTNIGFTNNFVSLWKSISINYKSLAKNAIIFSILSFYCATPLIINSSLFKLKRILVSNSVKVFIIMTRGRHIPTANKTTISNSK